MWLSLAVLGSEGGVRIWRRECKLDASFNLFTQFDEGGDDDMRVGFRGVAQKDECGY